ncbi:MAG: hypothetical protein CME06_06110 [Gemmatimonadetes bacterium]|nr:hypothetical protein [Gemmatimonadota bacterium]
MPIGWARDSHLEPIIMTPRIPQLRTPLAAMAVAWIVACSATDQTLLAPDGDPAEDGSPLPGVFDDDTTVSGELVIREMLRVSRGTTLTVAAGSALLFRDDGDSIAGIDVAGVLLAQGSASSPVRFGSADTVPRAGDWEGIYVHGGSAVLAHTRIDHARIGLRVSGGALARIDSCVIDSHEQSAVMTESGWANITGSTLEAERFGVRAEGGGVVVRGGSITGKSEAGFLGHASTDTVLAATLDGEDALVIDGGYQTLVRGCVLQGDRYGVSLVGRVSDALIDSNTVLPGMTGIFVVDSRRTQVSRNTIRKSIDAGIECRDADVEVTANLVDTCDIGLWVAGGDVMASGNALAGNHSDGIRIDAGVPEIVGNSIVGNGGYGVRTEVYGIDASGNWWGDASGPYQELYNPGGTGDRVPRVLIVNPWLDAPPSQ